MNNFDLNMEPSYYMLIKKAISDNPELVLEYKNNNDKKVAIAKELLNLSSINRTDDIFLKKVIDILEKTNVLVCFGGLGNMTGYLNIPLDVAKSRYSSNLYYSDDYFFVVFEDQIEFYGF